MTLSTKPEVHNILQSRQKRTEPQPQATGSEKFGKNLTYGSGDNAHRQTQTYKQQNNKKNNNKLCYLRGTARRAMSVKIFSTVTSSCTANPQQIAVMELEGYS